MSSTAPTSTRVQHAPAAYGFEKPLLLYEVVPHLAYGLGQVQVDGYDIEQRMAPDLDALIQQRSTSERRNVIARLDRRPPVYPLVIHTRGGAPLQFPEHMRATRRARA